MARRSPRLVLAAALVAVAASLTPAIATSTASTPATTAAAATRWWAAVPTSSYAPLKVLKTTKVDARTVEIELSTPYLTAPTYVRVLLPSGYAASTRRYPVLFLLDGCCNSAPQARDWTTKGTAQKATAAYPLITVMPDCGQGGMYTDWWNNGAGGDPKWESYLIGQLVPWVDAHFRTLGTRQGRGIAGLSMGGFGTMSLAGRHPDLFSAAASFSGIVDSTQNPEVDEGLAAIDGGREGSLWGPFATQEIRWRGHNPVDLAANLRGMGLWIRTGNGLPGPLDPPATSAAGAAGDAAGGGIEGGVVHPQNVAFDQTLTSLGIAHLYDDYGPGTHSWPYWDRDLAETVPLMMKVLLRPDTAPASFSDTSIEPTFSDYGYVVAVTRSVLEFATLSSVTASGFSLTGSGSAVVTTAPRYRPGGWYSVQVTDPEQSSVSLTGATVSGGASLILEQASRTGSLRIPVSMGPSNTVQQDTPGASYLRHSGTATVTIRPARG